MKTQLRMLFKRLGFAFLLVNLLPASPIAAPKKKSPMEKPKQEVKAKPNTLDFEADVIEGQRKAPELFLQTEVQKPSLDSVLFQRKDFNDFHAADSIRRPRLAEPPAGGKK